MALKSVLITGANRGIGLGLVKEFAKACPEATIIATARKEQDDSSDLGQVMKANSKVKLLVLDVTKPETFADFASKVEGIVGDGGLQLLINNAGLLPQNRMLDSVTPEDMMLAFQTNCIGPLFLTRALLPALKLASSKGGDGMSATKACAVLMSTAVASIAENDGGNSYAYRCSKTALNMAMKNLSIDLKKDGILVMAMHPGWVLTEMGGPNAMISVDQCVSTMVETIMQLSEKDHAKFLRYNNTPIQW